MLELTDALVIVLVVVVAGLITHRVLTAKDRIELRKYEMNLKRTEAARRAASRSPAPRAASGGGPEWLYDAAEELGLGEYLDQDEMPPELVRFMPMIKGFIESGGLERFLKAGGGQGSTLGSGAPQEGSPGAGGGEGGW